SFRDGKGPPSTVTATGYHSSPGSGSQAPFFKRSACFCLLFSHFLNSRSAKHTELRILNVTFGSSERQIQIGLPHWLQVSSCKIWYASRSMKSYGVQGSVGCSWKIMADGRMPAAIAALIFVMTWVLGGHVSAVTKNPRQPPCRSRIWQIQIGLPHWLQVSSCKIWYASRSMKSYGVQGSVGCSWKIMADGRMPAAIAALIFVMTWVLGGHVSAVTKNPRQPPCRSRSWRTSGSTGGGSDGPTRVAAGSRRERAPRRR